MSKNKNRNWTYLSSLNLQVGDLVQVTDWAWDNNNQRTTKSEYQIVVDLEMKNKTSYLGLFEMVRKREVDDVSFNYVKTLTNGSYYYVVLFSPANNKKILYPFHPTYAQDSWKVTELDNSRQGWITPAKVAENAEKDKLIQKANVYHKQMVSMWMNKFTEPDGYADWCDEMDEVNKNRKSRYHRRALTRHEYFKHLFEKEFETRNKVWEGLLLDALNGWDKNVDTIKGCVVETIPMKIKDFRVTVNVWDSNKQYDVTFKLDEDVPYPFMDWDVEERNAYLQELIAGCPEECKDYLSVNEHNFWGTKDWVDTLLLNSFYADGNRQYRYSYNDRDEE